MCNGIGVVCVMELVWCGVCNEDGVCACNAIGVVCVLGLVYCVMWLVYVCNGVCVYVCV